MSEAISENQSEENTRESEVEGKRYMSERGPFEINTAPEWKGPYPVGTFDGKKIVSEGWDVSKLVKDGNEEEVYEKVGEMLELAASGSSENRLMRQDEGFENGFRSTHVWFGPNFELFRHSHPAGDCMYLIMAGELTMGKRTLKAGSTVFVPNEMPYKFVAGPDGVEVVEFRSGGRIAGKAGMRLEENSLEAVQKIIDGYRANAHLWKAPPTFSDTGHIKPHLEQN
ncbi:MAG: hypothetical protein VX513_00720 [Pseudomonadota bacterium]|nr:hypothetical protein [Pseudomonadota bacterium]